MLAKYLIHFTRQQPDSPLLASVIHFPSIARLADGAVLTIGMVMFVVCVCVCVRPPFWLSSGIYNFHLFLKHEITHFIHPNNNQKQTIIYYVFNIVTHPVL